ncbi:unnamed protein product, partial [Closterium sp. NIES-53]
SLCGSVWASRAGETTSKHRYVSTPSHLSLSSPPLPLLPTSPSPPHLSLSSPLPLLPNCPPPPNLSLSFTPILVLPIVHSSPIRIARLTPIPLLTSIAPFPQRAFLPRFPSIGSLSLHFSLSLCESISFSLPLHLRSPTTRSFVLLICYTPYPSPPSPPPF